MSSVGQFGMSSSNITESPVRVMFHNTPVRVSPAVRPQPQPRPAPDNTGASATQFAVGDDGGGLGVVDVGVGVGAVVVGVGDRTSVHAERSRTTPSVMA